MRSSTSVFAALLAVGFLAAAWSFTAPSPLAVRHTGIPIPHCARGAPPSSLSLKQSCTDNDTPTSIDKHLLTNDEAVGSRRSFVATMASSSLATIGASAFSFPALAAGQSTADATITDKIFIEFKGIPPAEGADPYAAPDRRIVVGLFGKDAPQPVSILKQLTTREGYKSKCKPLDTSRLYQKEQLEANKVYNNCMENEDTVGVNYDYSSVWRVVKDERIDLGAISGKFIARENPTFEDAKSGLTHDAAGVVSVRRGDDGGYGFTISASKGNPTLDEENVVVGRVIEGMDVVERLNALPVVKSALAGGQKAKAAPSRGCRYGGSEYFCNENKPLKKVLLDKFGVL